MTLNTRLPGSAYDAVCQRAAAQGVSVSALTRTLITRQLAAAGEDDESED